MTDTSGHNDNGGPARGEVPEQFPAGERDRIRNLWRASAHADIHRPHVTAAEVESALSDVHRRIGIGKAASGTGKEVAGSATWRWILAAAVILLILGTGILFTPQTETAPYGEITTTAMPDGSVIELNSGSQIWYNRFFSHTNRTIQLDGEAFFSVTEGERPFIIHAHNTIVKVTGTKFNVRSWSDDPGVETEVTVSEGHVRFASLHSPDSSVTVAAGQLSRWNSGLAKPTPPQPVNTDRVLGWRDHKLIFNNRPLAVIVNELERRFDISIELDDEEIARETLTTFYAEIEGAETVIKDICRLKGLRYAKTANGFRVYR